ncbi:cyclic nucleotide-gated ion channel [Bosea psychrotolerans]|uniref:Voltage-gated potassium channel n=1 Tax=Bosea psychrotolerans TaxID=1871628 RepID=A0A2S4MHQ5_9HYPH|nr:cyclic nucleotide-gated ion channel [Bosea psychrotolerans]POR53947.1 voltage-gated potassium channel [Bosea psychrotolerans]
MTAAASFATWRRQIHLWIDHGAGDDLIATMLHRGLVALICANVVAIVLESVPSIAARFSVGFQAFEFVSLLIFALEYAIRLWAAPEHARYRGLSPARARLAYAASVPAVIDLLATLPLLFGLMGFGELKVLLLLRLLRFFKLGRYSPGMASLSAALAAERKALFACFVILMGVMLMAASAMHIVEHEAQAEKFGTIPDAMWWAIITLTTVGYGDVYPVTAAGKAVAAVTAVLGLIMLALPVGIVATAFAQEIHRREFVVTWSMIARVPLFGGLDAAEIAEVMQFLRAQTVRNGAVVMHEGEPGRALYFIASGEVEILLPEGKKRLDEGHFFGELRFGDMAIASHSPCPNAAVATAPSKLLVLDPVDFHALTKRHPKLAERIRALAQA